MSLIKNLSTKEKVELLKELYHDIAGKGQDGDTMLAHINPKEALLLKMYGGSGTINPYTGLPEYKKAVKKIAKVAAIAVAAYASYKTFGAASAARVGSTAFWKGTTPGLLSKIGTTAATVGKGLYSSGALQKIGLGLQVAGYMQQRKSISAQASASKAQAEEQRRINQAQERYRLVQERRQRLDILRQARIQTGGMESQMGQSGLGLVGTSGFTGATSAIQTQATANLGALQASSGASTAISRMSQTAANYASQANQASAQQQQWAQVGSLGGKLYEKGPEIFDLSKSIFG